VTAPLVTYTLRLADDAFVLSHRLAEWSAHAPELEEDVALTNIALDLLGQARPLFSYAGEVEAKGRDEDDLAYLRAEREFLNCQLVEQPNADFAVTMARQLLFSVYQQQLYARLESSTDEMLAAVAAKGSKEIAYHVHHAAQWVLRLGDGTAESHRRMQAGLDRLWPYSHELFETDEVVQLLAADGVAVDPASLRDGWLSIVDNVLGEATLQRPPDGWQPTGGRSGVHTESFGFLIAQMQHLHRAYPGATW
jgi:ring-1,2-phenylacetyl-CoA epoxidase subunit PaaC